MPDFAVILPAAGSSLRFGGDKLAATLAGQSVLDRTIAAFESRPDVRLIIVAGRRAPPRPKLLSAAGGSCRAETVRNGVIAVPESIEWIAIHDAARPLVSQDLIDRVFSEAVKFGAAAPALPVDLTIKHAAGPLPTLVERTIPRAQLWTMQTPQFMRRVELLDALNRCPIPLGQVTDDLQLLEMIGKPARLVAGDERNIKLTRPSDLKIAEMLLSS